MLSQANIQRPQPIYKLIADHGEIALSSLFGQNKFQFPNTERHRMLPVSCKNKFPFSIDWSQALIKDIHQWY